MRRDITVVTINVLVAGLLVLLALNEWDQGAEQTLPATAGADRSGSATKTLSEHKVVQRYSADSFAETVERPLFSQSRRPPPPELVEEAADRPTAIDKLVLTGIVSGPDLKIAILLNGEDQKELRLQEGEDIGGWRLAKFEGDAVTFSQNGRSREFPLYRERPVQPSPQTTQTNVAVQRYLTRRQRTGTNQ